VPVRYVEKRETILVWNETAAAAIKKKKRRTETINNGNSQRQA
jgi:hypothetical protein